MDSFDDMNLSESLLRGIYAYGFEKPSAIQQRAILPCIKGETPTACLELALSLKGLLRVDGSHLLLAGDKATPIIPACLLVWDMWAAGPVC